jgi:hypothetical protein
MKTLTIVKGKSTNKETRTATNIPLYKSNFGYVTVPENDVNAFCDTCDNTDYATEKVLTACGWEISKNYQFCPVCAIG